MLGLADSSRLTGRYVFPPHTISMVGEGGFEPPTSCTQSRCATELRYSPCCRRLSEQVKRSANGQVTTHPAAAGAARAQSEYSLERIYTHLAES